MKKEIDITMLMDSYTDNEFNIGGEAGVEAEKVVSAVMPQVKTKKKIKPLFKVLMASAAAAAAAIVGVTVASSSLVGHARFTTALGVRVDYDFTEKWEGDDIYIYGHSFSYWPEDLKYPVEEIDGRLYFTADGQNEDITDLIDRKTPYIYTYIVPQTSLPVHIIVGGEGDELSYVELMYFEGYGWNGWGNFMDDEDPHFSLDANINESHGTNFEGGYRYRRGWYLSDKSVSIRYDLREDVNGEKQYSESWHEHHSAGDIPLTWEEDCPDAWLISALLQLELFELPDPYLIDPVKQTADGRVMLVAGGQNTDITDLISESEPYVYAAEHYEDQDSYILIGGTPRDYGWALICRNGGIMWIADMENINDGDIFKEWFLNGAAQIGYDDIEKLSYDMEWLEAADGQLTESIAEQWNTL